MNEMFEIFDVEQCGGVTIAAVISDYVTCVVGFCAESFDFELVTGEIGAELMQVCHDGEFVGYGEDVHVTRFDYFGDAETFGCFEGFAAVGHDVVWVESGHVTGEK